MPPPDLAQGVTKAIRDAMGPAGPGRQKVRVDFEYQQKNIKFLVKALQGSAVP